MKRSAAVLFILLAFSFAPALEIPENLKGFWSLDMESGEPAWMDIAEKDGQPTARFRLYVGPEGPYKIQSVNEGRIRFERVRKNRKTKSVSRSVIEAGLSDGTLQGTVTHYLASGEPGEVVPFTGKSVPPMPEQAPDLSKVKFGEPISLFNGKDLSGWRPYEPDKINGWSVEDGLLVNTTTKTDFSATGDHANLRTEAEFEDFRLHIEFLIGKDRNSGVYLRGMYEAQVVDRDSRMQGINGPGALFSRIIPSENAGKVGGKWQTYDLTLVDRHVTVVLNGVKVIDNQPVDGPTGGAIYTDPSAPGPIYLQGDHTSVKFRNIYLEPVLNQ